MKFCWPQWCKIWEIARVHDINQIFGGLWRLQEGCRQIKQSYSCWCCHFSTSLCVNDKNKAKWLHKDHLLSFVWQKMWRIEAITTYIMSYIKNTSLRSKENCLHHGRCLEPLIYYLLDALITMVFKYFEVQKSWIKNIVGCCRKDHLCTE